MSLKCAEPPVLRPVFPLFLQFSLRLSCIDLLVIFFLCSVLSLSTLFFSIISFRVLSMLLLTSWNHPLLLSFCTPPLPTAFLSPACLFWPCLHLLPLSFLYLLSFCLPPCLPPIVPLPFWLFSPFIFPPCSLPLYTEQPKVNNNKSSLTSI